MRLRRGLVASGLTGSRVRAAAGSAATSPMSSHVSKLAAVNTCFWIMKIAATTLAEVFYWVAILVSNTLGTVLGDFLADSSGLGFVGVNPLIYGGPRIGTPGHLFYQDFARSPVLDCLCLNAALRGHVWGRAHQVAGSRRHRVWHGRVVAHPGSHPRDLYDLHHLD